MVSKIGKANPQFWEASCEWWVVSAGHRHGQPASIGGDADESGASVAATKTTKLIEIMCFCHWMKSWKIEIKKKEKITCHWNIMIENKGSHFWISLSSKWNAESSTETKWWDNFMSRKSRKMRWYRHRPPPTWSQIRSGPCQCLSGCGLMDFY